MQSMAPKKMNTPMHRGEVPPATPEEMAARAERRQQAIAGIKSTPVYQKHQTGDWALEAILRNAPEPVTPDPLANISKRHWEAKVATWRTCLREMVGAEEE